MSIVAAGAGRVAPDEMISSLENKRISINEAEPPRKFRMVGAKVRAQARFDEHGRIIS